MLHSLCIYLFFPCIVSTVSLPSSTVRLIIDTDGVYDDIRGLAIALTHPLADVLAITTTHGGVSANQSAANVARFLRALDKQSVPIFMGSQDSLVPKGPVVVWEDLFGSDGVGGVPDALPKTLPSDFSATQSQNAVDAIIELTKKHLNVTLVALGPLTNYALALRKDPGIAKRIRGIVIMGGNYLGVGNSKSNSTAEFNFLMDPEAAHIVLSSIHTIIVPWDTCFLKGPEYSQEVNYEDSLQLKTPLSYFLSNITHRAREYNKVIHQQYAFVDDIAVAIAIDPTVALKKIKLCGTVEMEKEAFTRGQVAVDWLSTGYNATNQAFEAMEDKNDQNWLSHHFVTEYDVVKINRMLIDAVTAPCEQKPKSEKRAGKKDDFV